MVRNQSADTSQRFRPAYMEKGPGPATYRLPGTTGYRSHDPTKYAKPAYSFGVRHKQFSTIAATALSPGPVYYISPQITRHGKDGTPVYSLSGRLQSLSSSCTPAPNAYYIENCPPTTCVRPPHYSFGIRTRIVTGNNASPSPSSYSLPNMIGSKVVGKSSAAAFSMTGRSKIGSFHEDLSKTPRQSRTSAAFGNYILGDLHYCVHKAHKPQLMSVASFPMHYTNNESSRTPGPGTYKLLDSTFTRIRQPCYSMTGRHYPPTGQKNTPGPGTYSPERVYIDKPVKPQFSFGIKHSEYISSFVD